MARQLKIACLTQRPSRGIQSAKLSLSNLVLEWEMVQVDPSWSVVCQTIESYREGYDAVVLEGLPVEFRIGAEKQRLVQVLNGVGIGDGACLRSTLERYLVAQL